MYGKQMTSIANNSQPALASDGCVKDNDETAFVTSVGCGNGTACLCQRREYVQIHFLVCPSTFPSPPPPVTNIYGAPASVQAFFFWVLGNQRKKTNDLKHETQNLPEACTCV